MISVSFSKGGDMKTILLMLIIINTIYAIDPIRVPDTITVATEVWPPFRIQQDDSITSGIDIDILEKVAEEMGLVFVIKQFPWVRCLYSMENGSVDIMTGLAYTDERAQYITYSGQQYYQCNAAFYTAIADSIDIVQYEDLQGLEIGYTRGSAYFEPFNSDTTLLKKDFHGEKNLLQILLYDRVNTIIGTDCQVDYDIAQMGYGDQIIRQPFVPNDPVRLYFGISKKSKFNDRWDEFNEILDRVITEGFVASTAEQYFE